MKREKRLLRPVLAAAFVLLCGCDTQDAAKSEPGKDTALPRDLQKLQGTWTTVSTNAWAVCSVVFSDYTIRLKCQKAGGADVLKRNVSIKAIDEQNKTLLMYTDSAAWRYDLRERGDGTRLGLGFYNGNPGAWGYAELKRE